MKKRLLALLLSLALIFSCIPDVVHAEEDDDYIEISTAKQLYQIRSNMEGKYKLVNDIDLTEATAEGGIYDFNGCGWNPIGSNNTYSNTPFTGVLDGQGYTIKGMRIRIDSDMAPNYVALFSENEGTIKNINIKNASIVINVNNSITNKADISCGFIAAVNNGEIKNVGVYNSQINSKIYWGSVSNKQIGYNAYFGGIVAINNGSIVSCYNGSDISVEGNDYYRVGTSTESGVYPNIHVGGITAKMSSDASINCCVNEGTLPVWKEEDNYRILRTRRSYGIGDDGQISNSYNTFPDATYGISMGSVKNCYYLKKTSGGYCVGDRSVMLNENQMKDPDFFEGFDFENTWRMSDETIYKYPQLQSIRNGITKVEIVSEPTNEIVVGTTLNYEGAVARIFREDGSTEDVILTPDNTTGGDTSTTGVKTVTYSYKGASASFDINVVPVRVKSLEVVALPQKTEYVTGQEFVSNGLSIRAVYNNGTKSTCNDYMLSDVDSSTPGTKTVTVSYNGIKTSFDVNYIAKAMTDLKITTNPTKTVYDEGEAFNSAGMIVTAYYNDDTSVNVTDYTIGDMSGYGAVKLPITYGGFTVNVDVTIRKLVKSVSFNQESFELYEGKSAKLAVTVDPEDADNNELVWTSGDTNIATVGSDGTVTAVTEGNTVITAKVKEDPSINTACNITVLKVKPETLIIKSLPDKTVYLEGEEFDSSGLSVSVINNDKSEETNVEFTLSKPDTTLGKKSVLVSYKGITASFEIEYIENKVTELKVKALPEKCKYLVGEEFDPTGLKVVSVYNGLTERECKDYTISNVDSTVGTKTVEITLGELKTSFQVVYYSNQIRSLTVTKMPIKTTYKEGEPFDPAGLEVTAVYDGGISRVINEYQVGPIEGTGNVLIDISCGDIHTELTISVESTGGMNELLELLEGESSHTIKKSDLKVWINGEYLYLSYSFYDVWNRDQSICWKIEKNTGKATVDYTYIKNTSKTTAVSVTGTASLNTKNYYPGMMLSFGCSELQTRERNEFNLLGSKYVSDGTMSIYQFLMSSYNISLTKCGFDSLLSTEKKFEKSQEEIEEVSKLVSLLSMGDVSFTSDGYVNTIHYYPGTRSIEFKIVKSDTMSGVKYTRELKYLYDTKSLFHYADFTFKFTVESPSTGDRYYQYAGYADASMMSDIYIPFKLTKTDVSDMERQYFAEEIESYGELGDSLSELLLLQVNSYLAKNKEIDMTKCGWYHLNSLVCQTHSWGSKKVIQEATYTHEGVCQYTCSKCGKTKKEVVPKLVCTYHAWDSGKVVIAATVSNTGIMQYTCKNCGATKQSTIPQLQTGWQQINKKWYYFNSSGEMQTGWQKIGGKWYCFNASGEMLTGWQKLSNKWYFFNSSGAMLTGWQKLSNKWYYFNPSGDMVTGWKNFGKVWYYFNAGGDMVTGWKKISNKWYYFNASGVMQTGWQSIGGKWYFFSSGVMKTGWMSSGGKWYYFDASGAMATGAKKIGTKTYQFNSSGVCLNP